MGNQIYSKGSFIIIDMKDGYIVINQNKDFKDGHTHITNFKTAKYLIDMVMHRRMPYHLPIYLLVSLMRLTDDEDYKGKINDLVENKKNRKTKYVNRSC